MTFAMPSDSLTLDDLTPRQREIARLVGQGLMYEEIAKRLRNMKRQRDPKVSTRTVQAHVTEIARKLPEDGRGTYRRVLFWVLDQERKVG